MSKYKVRVCPRCGSPEISEISNTVGGWLVPKTYYCTIEDCGYSGSIYVEIEANEVEHFQAVINAENTIEPAV